ncbi:MAG: D-alanyl-D-alanine dipeptidase [Bacteroidetes bacterium]|nr:MAG: D-alanyl-D-alanine dipeptidase [Bacteroidota bacterium]
MKLFWYFLVLVLFAGCGQSPVPPKPVDISRRADTITAQDTLVKQDSIHAVVSKDSLDTLSLQLLKAGLVDVQSLDSGIRVDLRYSTTDNFLGIDVYGDFNRCFLQADVAEKLVHAQRILRKKYPYYNLVVYDAVRPLHIQRMMWDTLKLPPGEKQKYLSNPANGSLHNYGAAVDLSIINDSGFELDMGTPFDFFGEMAHPQRENALLEEGKLSRRQVANREILRGVMREAGFFNIQTEWWHFNSCRREEAKLKYALVE